MRPSIALPLLPLLVLAACQSSTYCTDELRGAVTVTIETNDLPVDSVTARLETETPCHQLGPTGSSDPFVCWEQGEGTYVVQVTSGSLTWTDSVYVAGDDDGCHVKRGESLSFDLEPETAD